MMKTNYDFSLQNEVGICIHKYLSHFYTEPELSDLESE